MHNHIRNGYWETLAFVNMFVFAHRFGNPIVHLVMNDTKDLFGEYFD